MPLLQRNAPVHTQLGLCNIHFHENAEHAGGEFAKYMGNGEGHGYQSGYGYNQAPNIPGNTGKPVIYNGSTTGPGYNQKGSPFQVTWSVRPKVAKVNIATVGQWCKDNVFNEDHAHGVRNLVKNPDLLSNIQ